jgi:hypothetical protein
MEQDSRHSYRNPVLDGAKQLVTESRRIQENFKQTHPVETARIEDLTEQLETALREQDIQVVRQTMPQLKYRLVTSPWRNKEPLGGKVKVVQAHDLEEAQSKCPWATAFHPLPDQNPFKLKWLCFENPEDLQRYQKYFPEKVKANTPWHKPVLSLKQLATLFIGAAFLLAFHFAQNPLLKYGFQPLPLAVLTYSLPLILILLIYLQKQKQAGQRATVIDQIGFWIVLAFGQTILPLAAAPYFEDRAIFPYAMAGLWLIGVIPGYFMAKALTGYRFRDF